MSSTESLSSRVVLSALLATIHDEWSSIDTWAIHAHYFLGMPKDHLDAIVVALQELEQEWRNAGHANQ